MLLCQQVFHKVAEMMLWCEERRPGKDGIYLQIIASINFTYSKGDQSKLDLSVSTSGTPEQ